MDSQVQGFKDSRVPGGSPRPPLGFRRLALIGVLGLLLPLDAGAQSPVPEHPLDALPPLSWTCPMHPDVIAGEAGSCPICKMDLVTTRVELAYTCPVHGVIHLHEPGICPIDGRTLQPVTLEMVWTCPEHPEVLESEPGVCRLGGEALELRWAARAHGDHNPKHGGLFFMAPDNWHHLEGTYPEPGLFRVHLYDDYTKPMDASEVQGRAVTREVFDSETRQTRELATFPLRPSADGAYLEARIEELPLPVTLTAKLRFEPDGEEARFDFTFPELSVEPPDGLPVAAVESTPGAVDGRGPDAAEDLVLELAIRQLRLQQLIRRGALDQVYLPALEAKDLALTLETKPTPLAEADRRTMGLAVKQLVRSAWLIDGYGDLGNRQAVEEAYAMFTAAVDGLKRLHGLP